MTTNRRNFLGGGVTAAASLYYSPPLSAAEGPPEATSISLSNPPTICTAPQYICEELLRAEGFTEIRYVDTLTPDVPDALAQGRIGASSTS